ncbi:GNAT family N-acetyltransferase [Rhodalgimonas zhirmunskyi]|uniref:GNAT family N-acetyltransferase n=1 Tax=Rhodalgimonas zhirmunskyi TaxID=2964767 RepID=A0AAJ1UCU9_9RHOB|nr:GNAT family N-acetyltransferase [Rhodoalgimonas zhirmunskyi]MDQ2093537.1 GNAT family N-acetyltransferase [Rhodoalgimonas zhirmunskyi]
MSEVILRQFKSDDAAWLIERHGTLYARDEGFDHTFGPLVAEILDNYIRDHDPGCERGWIAQQDGQRLGSIFCVRAADDTAKLRLFLLTPEARGKGLGRRMLTTCMDYARAQGYRRMHLWTHESHRAACALYAAHGWQLVSSTQVHSFGVDLIEQAWEIEL